jgi:hypothetical protein
LNGFLWWRHGRRSSNGKFPCRKKVPL